MSITIAAFFTQDNGQPATGLTLAEIALYLTAQDKATLAQTVIWDGSQHPTAETTNAGAYARNYEGDDLATYDYFAAAQYTGARTLDTNWITGSVGGAAGAGLTAQEVRDAMKLAPSAGAAADGSIDNLLAALPAAVEAALSGYQVIVQSAVSTDGQITVYQGYDYAAADDRAIEFEVATPDFTGATTALKFDGDTYAGAVVNPGLTTQLLRFEFTAVQTAAMTAGYHAYRLEVTRAGRLLLEETGVINVKE